MKRLDVIVDGRRLNTVKREGFPLSLSYSIESAENPAQLAGSFTKRSIEFPPDGETAIAFEEWGDPTRVNPSALLQKPARIDVDGLTVLAGVAQVDEATAAGNRHGRSTQGVRAGVFGSNATWFAKMKETAIRDLGLMPDHDLTSAEVSDNDNPNPDTETWGYCLLKTVDWPLGDNIQYTDMQPFLFKKAVLKEAFRIAGYTLISDFFDTDEGKRLILPVPFRPYPDALLETWGLLVMDENNGTAVSGTPAHVTIAGDKFLSDPGGNYDTGTGFFTVPVSGYYIVGVETTSLQFGHTVRKNGTTSLGSFSDPCEIGIGVQGRVFLEEGDTLELMVQGNISPVLFCFLYVRADMAGLEPGTGVRLSQYGDPAWRVSDMILGLTHGYGLVWDTDTDAFTVTVEPRDRYQTSVQPSTEETNEGFYRVQEREDWSPKVDLGKDASVSTISSEKQVLALAWKSDGGDANVSEKESGNEFKMYDGHYTYPEGRFPIGQSRSENPWYCKTLHVIDNAIMHSASEIPPQVPILQKNKMLEGNPAGEERGEFGPRILYFAGRREGLDGFVNLEDYGQYDFPAAFMVNYNDPTGLDPCLSFGNETLLGGATIAIGLLQRFHLQRIKRIEVGKMLTEYINFSPLDILGLDFRKKKLLGDGLYLLQKLNGYKPLSDGSTETVLLYDAMPDGDDLDKIESSSITGHLLVPIPNGE
jgi:hypothetical protein